MKRGVIIGLCLGVLLSIASPILFKYTNIIISLLVFFGFIAAIAVVILFVVTSRRMHEALSAKGLAQSVKSVVYELAKNPSKAASVLDNNKDVVASLALPFILNFGFLSLVAALLSAAATTSLVLVGMQQVGRLDRQNEIMERQMPLLLRQSIAATQTELATKHVRLQDTNAKLLELQSIMERAADVNLAQPDQLCVIQPELNCELASSYRLSDSIDLLIQDNDSDGIALEQVNYLRSLAGERKKRWRGALAFTRHDSDSQFLRVTGLQDLIIQCSPDLAPMLSLQNAVLNERKWEELISGNPIYTQPAQNNQRQIDENQLNRFAELQETYLPGSTRVGFFELVNRINLKNEANLGEWQALESSCKEKSRFLAQDINRLEQSLESDQAELQQIVDRTLNTHSAKTEDN